MKRTALLGLVAVLVMSATAEAASLPGQASKYCNIPASVDLAGAQKTVDVPFLGIFDGKWDGKVPATVIFYKVDGSNVRGFYAWKDYKPWNVAAGCAAIKGKIGADALEFSHGGDRARFTLSGSGLRGTFVFHPGKGDELVEKSSFSRKR